MSTWTEKDIEYMKLVLELAKLAPAKGEVPIAAALVLNHQIVAQAHNYREGWQDPTAHAEIVAIREAAARLGSWRMTGSTLYVTVEPCAMCVGAIIQSRISRLVFGAWDYKAGACGSVFDIPVEPRLNHRVDVLGGLLAQDCQDLLQVFFRGLRDQVGETVPLLPPGLNVDSSR